MAIYRLFFVGVTGGDYRHTGVVHCANAEILLRSNMSCRAVLVRQDDRDVARITRDDLERGALAKA